MDGANAALRQVRHRPTWKCVQHEEGNAHPGIPTLRIAGCRTGVPHLRGLHAATHYRPKPPPTTPNPPEPTPTTPHKAQEEALRLRQTLAATETELTRALQAPTGDAAGTAGAPAGGDAAAAQVGGCPAWKCVLYGEDPSHPGTPTLTCLAAAAQVSGCPAWKSTNQPLPSVSPSKTPRTIRWVSPPASLPPPRRRWCGSCRRQTRPTNGSSSRWGAQLARPSLGPLPLIPPHPPPPTPLSLPLVSPSRTIPPTTIIRSTDMSIS